MPDSSQSQLAAVTDLASNQVASVAEALNAILADSFALYLKTKNFHWHMSGPHFRDYHLLLDDQAAQIFATTDAIAERIRKTGGTTLRSIGHVGRLQRICDNDRDFVDPHDMLVELYRDNFALVGALRAAKADADDARDNASSGLLDQWTDSAEQRAWFLREATGQF